MEFGSKSENSKAAELDSELGGVWQVQSRSNSIGDPQVGHLRLVIL